MHRFAHSIRVKPKRRVADELGMSTPTQPSSPRRQRGATLTGYALTMAVMVVAAMGSMALLEDNSETFLTDSGTNIGEPRQAEDFALESPPSGLPFGNSVGTGTTTTTTTSTPSSSTPSSSTPSSSTPPSTAAPVLMAAANYDYTGPSYAGDPAGAQASGISKTVSFVAATAGTYRVEFEILTSGDGTADSIHADIGNGLYRWNTLNYIGSPTWQSVGQAGGTDPTSLEISLTDSENFDVTMYPREPGVRIGNVRIVRIGD